VCATGAFVAVPVCRCVAVLLRLLWSGSPVPSPKPNLKRVDDVWELICFSWERRPL
jgi:hypothetical protein